MLIISNTIIAYSMPSERENCTAGLATSSGQLSELVLLEDVARREDQRVDYAGDRRHATDNRAHAGQERVQRLRLWMVLDGDRTQVVFEPGQG